MKNSSKEPQKVFPEDEGEEEEENYDEDEEEEEEDERMKEVEEIGDGSKSIVLKVKKGVSRNETRIKINRDLELRWLMTNCCRTFGMDFNKTKFMYNGARLKDTDTPLQLNMLDLDVIFAIPKGVNERSGCCYETLCIRMRPKSDTFVRVTRTEPLLDQLRRHLFNDQQVVNYPFRCWFIYNGLELSEDDTVDKLTMEEGDIIDAFNSYNSRYSLSILDRVSSSCFFYLKVNNLNGIVKVFRVKGSTPIRSLARKYAELISAKAEKVRLIFDGRHLHLDKTVEEQLVDDCEIFGVLNQP